ncbi:MAG: cyclic nucleotide-binding domain-containing protein [Tannerellaceae bacterium]|nr:cyclic nucleotide-binding domain-containing protein [Tannerellaceae bacterium]
MVADDCLDKLLADIPEALVQNEQFIDELKENTSFVQVKKGDYLLRAGDICQHAWFINKGLYINLYISEKGQENVTGFSSDVYFPFLSAIGYFTQSPSDFEIKSLEEGELLCFTRSFIDNLSLRYPLFARYYQDAMMMIIAKHYSLFALRQSCKSEEFLNYLYTHYAWMVNRIPDKYIACYMGISNEWYCKLKKRVLKLN